jgi:hypothetical protein
MDLPNEIRTEIKNTIQYDVPLYPIGNLIIKLYLYIMSRYQEINKKDFL